MTDRTGPHETLVNDLLIALTALPETIFYRNASGVGKTPNGHYIRAGVLGGGDIMGGFKGRGVAIEVKTGLAVQRKSQKDFQRAWERAGCLYLVCRSVNDALTGLGIKA